MDAAGQLTIDDAIADCERESRRAETAAGGDLERIGDSFAWGWTLLELLERQGWGIHVTAPFAGQIDAAGTPGVVVIATHPAIDGLEIKIAGRTVADCATPLTIECGRYARAVRTAR